MQDFLKDDKHFLPLPCSMTSWDMLLPRWITWRSVPR